MKNYLSKISCLFAFVAFATLTSCSDDDDASAPNLQVNLTEVGHGNPPHAHAGEDLHLEAEILAAGRIANVKLEIHAEGNNSVPDIVVNYNDYNGLINATFHKHVDIPASHPAGMYHLHLTVTDESGNSKTAEAELEVFAAETTDQITIALTELGHGTIGNAHVHAGEEMHIEGVITSVHPIATVSIEIHSESDTSAPHIDATFANYAGQTTANFHEHLQIADSQPVGHYHFHMTVTDNQGGSKTVEYELEIE